MTMSKYQLTFTLRQHTPIIHFQADQEGATLRATEVKPKLDRFILKKLGNGDYEQGVQRARAEGWLVGKGEKAALNYKMRIDPVSDMKYYLFFSALNQQRKENLKNFIAKHYGLDVEVIAPSPYFANNDKVKFYSEKDDRKGRDKKDQVKEIDYDELRFALYTDNDIGGLITCFNKDLLEHIEQSLLDFFLAHNFGTRQSKGFGCFYPHDLTEDEFIALLKANGKAIYKSTHTVQGIAEVFGVITQSWRQLKSGENTKKYVKSKVFKYLCEKGFRWEKRWMKKELKSILNQREYLKASKRNGQFNKPNDCIMQNYDCHEQGGYQSWNDNPEFQGDYRFGRAMLGLAEHYEFRTTSRILQVQVISQNGIERYKAPVTFKVFENQIYAIAEEQLLYNEPFQFEVKTKSQKDKDREIVDIEGRPKQLWTPSEEEWDLMEFLDKYFPCVGFVKQ